MTNDLTGKRELIGPIHLPKSPRRPVTTKRLRNILKQIRWSNRLWSVVVYRATDFAPYGYRDREDSADCSCGCVWFVPLLGQLGGSWGVCANPRSPRAGLLTWEHMGCPQFEAEAE